MSLKYAAHVNLKNTPQSEPLPGTKQVSNSAGGYSFAVDMWKRLERFLILGTEGGSYYANERKLTIENCSAVIDCIKADGLRAVRTIVEISEAARAPKNDPALLALALAVKHGERAVAFSALPKVARIGTHLFHFAEYCKAVGVGWGRGSKRAFANWYLDRSADSLALQVIKYQSRDGWSHRDLLRKAHPKTTSADQLAVFRWITKGGESFGDGENISNESPLGRIWAFEQAKSLTDASSVKALVRLIETYDLPRECVPTEALNFPAVWEALLPGMGLTALIRNLGKLTSIGLIAPLSATTKFVVQQLGDLDLLRKARIHPLAVLVALKTYEQGHGVKGSLTWAPVQAINDALDQAFYAAFKLVEPTNKNTLLALDISGSMDGGEIAGMPGVSPRVGSAAMALVTANVESSHHFVAFTAGKYRSMHSFSYGIGSGIIPLTISPRMSLRDVVKAVSRLPMGGTDCALPMLWATKNKVPVDTFCVYTDSETWAGNVHPKVALEEYRQKMGRPAKLVVIGMVANEFSIADPNDAGMLDVVGFDTATPSLIADFSR